MSYQTHFSAEPSPIAALAPGEAITLHTPSVLTRGDLPRTYDDLVIPVVGPVRVEGAQPGMTLSLSVSSIQVASEGAMVALPGYGAFGDLLDEPGGRVVPIRDGRCHLLEGVEFAVAPMVGKIGVAVPSSPPRSNTVGDHGGNMDCRQVGPGSTVLLPVQVEGALFYVGDAHARQGDGECLMTAVETEADVTIAANIHQGLDTRRPVILASSGEVCIVGHGESLDEASLDALREARRLLSVAHGWSVADAAMMMSALADLHVCQIVNPRKSAHVAVPAQYLPQFAAVFAP